MKVLVKILENSGGILWMLGRGYSYGKILEIWEVFLGSCGVAVKDCLGEGRERLGTVHPWRVFQKVELLLEHLFPAVDVFR